MPGFAVQIWTRKKLLRIKEEGGASLGEWAARLRSGGAAPVRRAALPCVALTHRKVRCTVVWLDREMYLRLAAHMPTISTMALKLKWWAVQDLNL